MQAFDHLQDLWQKHQVDVKVSADEMLQQAKKELNTIKIKSTLNIIGMLFSFCLIISIWVFIDFQKITTHIGLTIILLAIATSTLYLIRDYRLITNTDFTIDPKSYLSKLKTYQINRFALYSKMYWIYIIALSLGCIFYFIEIFDNLNNTQIFFALFITSGWMIFCSTIVRKAVFKRERERIQLLIDKFERLSNQFEDF